MARAGRKRKTGYRNGDGSLKRPTKTDIDDGVRTSRQPHRRALRHELRAGGVSELEVEKFATGEEAESPIGRLWAAGMLKQIGDGDIQAARDRYDAATMYAQVVGTYRATIGAPRDVAGSGRGQPCPADLLCALEPESCLCARSKDRYNRAFEALTRLSRRSLTAVNRVAVHREPIGQEDLVYLVAGLEELRRVFGLVGRRRSRQHVNAN
ncbi:hypothetical protein [Bradyrhizobium sp. 188]|uniref:hypothetical protein n=1 Tax=Bradyrhizobium sp. 188 TaxID=2782656 RepID=UPI001FF7C743|nr:hypothetical protein [Bradyrhizobium sp. 188]MCK1501477.1 hypothetical protein [Bradyrhizobium sp. 188]